MGYNCSCSPYDAAQATKVSSETLSNKKNWIPPEIKRNSLGIMLLKTELIRNVRQTCLNTQLSTTLNPSTTSFGRPNDLRMLKSIILHSKAIKASGSATADVQGLAQIVDDQIQINLKDTFSEASKLYKETTERVMKECFQICSEEYGVAIHYMDGVVANLKSKNYRNAREGLTGVYVDADTCKESFHEEPVRPSPLTKNNNDVKDLALIGSQIIHILG
ncbi:putative invertase inhibitor [Prunus dulcis]|uniref:putative invertase inhibitor n=1 Tax=Prunus dulcis TaxID=3755 RepID=UPI0014823453|nr:putative invertase inhibitor [Prunus dulcis]